jgi:hypothetical protein
VIDFRLTATGLAWGPVFNELVQTGVQTPGQGTRAGLPTLTLNPQFLELTAREWARTDDFDVAFIPTGALFCKDGSFQARYRGGDCEHGGSFSVLKTGSQYTLWARSAPNTCDLRGGTGVAFSLNSTLSVQDGLLYIQSQTFRDALAVSDERFLAFNADGFGGVKGSVTWHGPLAANSVSTLNFLLVDSGQVQITLQDIEIKTTPLQFTNGHWIPTGQSGVLTHVDLGARKLAPAESLSTDIPFTPSPAGWLEIDFVAHISDSSQSYVPTDAHLIQLP